MKSLGKFLFALGQIIGFIFLIIITLMWEGLVVAAPFLLLFIGGYCMFVYPMATFTVFGILLGLIVCLCAWALAFDD